MLVSAEPLGEDGKYETKLLYAYCNFCTGDLFAQRGMR